MYLSITTGIVPIYIGENTRVYHRMVHGGIENRPFLFRTTLYVYFIKGLIPQLSRSLV